MIDIQHFDRIKTFGNSMLPILQNGDIVYITHVPFNTITVNDIIIFKQDGHYVTHRVIYKKKNSLITKGDNNLTADPEVTKDKIIGIVTKVKREHHIFNPENIYLVQSSYYFKEIVTVTKVLKKNNINFVILKGLPLHMYYEGKHPRRIYADCDILIKSNDLQIVEQILKKKKYKKKNTSLTGEVSNGHGPEVSYYSTNNSFPVIFDIHIEPVFLMTQVNIGETYYSASLLNKMTEDFLSYKRNIIIQGYSFPILSAKHLIPYLSLHFFHHNFRGVFRLDLIHKVVMREKGMRIWKDMLFFINDYKLNNFVTPVFYLLKNYFNTSIPKSFQDSICSRNLFIKYIIYKIQKVSIYDSETRITAGINRFWLITLLSPQPLFKKCSILFNPRIINTAKWVIINRVKKLLK